MPFPPSSGPRRERHDTKTLVRLGMTERESGPVPKPPRSSAPEALESGQPPSVQLWFQGVREPVRARAELSEAALSLDAPLPFLELESVVGFMTADSCALAHGRIRRVALDVGSAQRVPRLRVEVGLTEAPDANEHEAAQAASPAPRPTTEAGAPPALHRPAALLQSSEGRTRTKLRPLLAGLLLGIACGAGATYAWARAQTAPTSAAPLPRARVAQPAAAAEPRIEPPSIVIALAAEDPAGPARASAARGLAALAPFVVAPPLVEEANADGMLEQADPPPPPEVPLEPELRAAGGQGDHGGPGFLQVRAVDTQTQVFIPMSGSADGMRQYELTTPGVAISLPSAVALAPLENYAIARGLVRRVWLRREGDGVQVRVITRRVASRTRVSFDADGLTVVLDM